MSLMKGREEARVGAYDNGEYPFARQLLHLVANVLGSKGTPMNAGKEKIAQVLGLLRVLLGC